MKIKNVPFIFSLVIYGMYKLLSYYSGEPLLSLLIFVIPLLLLLLNFILRKSLYYKSWFLSTMNFLLAKKTKVFTSEIPQELLFKKLLSVVEESEFKLLDSDSETKEILVATGVNFLTWGENIYVEFKQVKEELVEVKVTSVTIFGSHSFNRNEGNYQSFYNAFEESLTI